LNLEKSAKSREKLVFLTNSIGTIRNPYAKYITLHFITYTKINSIWIIDLNAKCRAVKF